MTVRLSEDDGGTWAASYLVHPGPSAYSCLASLPDGSIGLLFEKGDRHPYETITFVRLTTQPVNGGS
jgi:sialidase-1